MTKQMIAPPVCLNCGHLGEILPNSPQGVDASMHVGATCAWGPTHVHIVDARVHSCGQRKPLDSPLYTVPAPEAPHGGGTPVDGLGDLEEENGAPDGARAHQEAIETKIGGTE